MNINKTRSKYIVLFLIVLFGLLLRLNGLGRSLWLDEVISVNSQIEFERHLSNIFEPLHIYFVMLHLFASFGISEIILRLPSVIFGVSSIFMIYKVAEQFFGRSKEGLIGSFLLSISTMHIWYSQEARYYSFSVFLTLLSVFLFYKAIKEMKKKIWIGYVIATVLVVLSHYFMIFVFLIEFVFIIFMMFKKRSKLIIKLKTIAIWKISVFFFGLIILLILSLPLIQKMLNLFLSGSAIEGVSAWGIPIESFFHELFSNFSFGYSFSFISTIYGDLFAIFSLSFFILLFFFGLFVCIKNHRETGILLLIWVLLPAIIIFLISVIVGSPVVAAKYMIFILPGYLIVIARGITFTAEILLQYYYRFIYGLSSVPLLKRKQILISSGLIILLILTMAGTTYGTLDEHYKNPQENWKAAASYLEMNVQLGDVIIIEPDILEQCLVYYYEKNSNKADYMKNITTTIMPSEFPFVDFMDLVSKNERTWIISSPRHERHIYWKMLDWIQENCINLKSFTEVTIYHHSKDLIIIPANSKDISYYGLDYPLNKTKVVGSEFEDEKIAIFWNNNDYAIINLDVDRPSYYEIGINVRSGWTPEKGWFGTSSIELFINNSSMGITTFSADDLSYIKLGTFYLDSGVQEIKITCRQGLDFGDSGIHFDKVIFRLIQ